MSGGEARERRRIVRDLIARVASLECSGACFRSCGPTECSPAEAERIRRFCEERQLPFHDLSGEENRAHALALMLEDLSSAEGVSFEKARCPFLSAENRCTIYSVRPAVCRIYGVTEKMPCPNGCKPRLAPLTTKEAHLLVNISGNEDWLEFMEKDCPEVRPVAVPQVPR